MLHEITCPFCESSKRTTILKKDDIIPSICKDCGLIYLNPRGNKHFYKEFYRKSYNTHVKRDTSSIINAGEFETYSRIYDRVKKHFQKEDIHILDIGSGTSDGLRCLNTKFPCASLFGIEPSKELAHRYDNNIKLIGTDIEGNFNHKNSHFDLIILNHVFEHLLYPKRAIKNIKKLLSDDGILYIAVPNFNARNESLYDYFELQHTLYLTKKTLNNIIEAEGFINIFSNTDPKDSKGELFSLFKKSKTKNIIRNDFHFQIENIKKAKNKETKIYYKLKNMLRKTVIKTRMRILHSKLLRNSKIKKTLRKKYMEYLSRM